MVSLRLYYLVVAAGFGLLSASSALGSAPRWPNQYAWSAVAGATAIGLAIYAIVHTRPWLRLATSMVLVASAARLLGWIYSAPTLAGKIGGASVWLIVGGLMNVVHVKARR